MRTWPYRRPADGHAGFRVICRLSHGHYNKVDVLTYTTLLGGQTVARGLQQLNGTRAYLAAQLETCQALSTLKSRDFSVCLDYH